MEIALSLPAHLAIETGIFAVRGDGWPRQQRVGGLDRRGKKA
jgi:hypothetical protein